MAAKKKISVKNQADTSLYGGARETNPKRLTAYTAKVQLQRIRQDILKWREALIEAENAWRPHRVKMMQLYYDTINDGHAAACIKKRKDLTLLKDFHIVDQEGNENEDYTKIFKQTWFNHCLNYILDAPLYGYSLIQLGDIVKGAFKNVEILKRHHVSPDRLNYVAYIYALSGINFMDEEFARWTLYVPTPSDIGVSNCGYGLLYKVSFAAIFIRNTIGYNGDFVELFAQPIRKGKTTKTEEAERDLFERALQEMGSSAYIMLDEEDEVELMESALGGTGYKGYESFESRMEKRISKILLGHADALDSTPGKLGSTGDKSPAQQALEDTQVTDNRFCQDVINTDLIPKMVELGMLPEGFLFEFKNDNEKEEFRRREDESNKATTEIVKTLTDAGFEVDEKYIIERTGIPVKKKEVQPLTPGPADIGKSLQNRLDKLYV